MYYSGAASTTHQRVQLTIRRSDDSGATWPKSLNGSGSLVLDHGPSGYSCLVPAPLTKGGHRDGACGGVLYEAAGGVIRFVHFPLDLADEASCGAAGGAAQAAVPHQADKRSE